MGNGAINLSSAIIFAANCHNNQTRKHNELPYIIHPLSVMNTLIECGFVHENLLIAAVLHDVVEDCNISITDIYTRFGYVVSCLVQDVTKCDLTYQGDNRKEKWEYYLNYLKYKCALVKALKLADRYCNLLDFARDWNTLDDEEKKFVKDVYIKEAESLIEVCNNEEKSTSLLRLIFKLKLQIHKMKHW